STACRSRRRTNLPRLPWRFAGGPQFFQLVFIAQRIHGLPEAAVQIGLDLAARHERLDRLPLEHPEVVVDFGDNLGREHEEAAVDPAAFVFRLLLKRVDVGLLDAERAEARDRLHAGEGDKLAMVLVEGDGRLYV